MGERTYAWSVWGIAFPLLLYFILSAAIKEILQMLIPAFAFPKNAMWRLTIENLLLLPVFYGLYRRDRNCLSGKKKRTFGWHSQLLVILTSVCLSRGVNLLLNLTALPKLFPGYEGISDGIYSCSLLSQIAASVVSASLLEEVLMRGLVYHRLKGILYNKKKALVGSALLFAVFHGNVLQGVYAFFLGLLFAWIFETYQSLLPAVIAHMAANAASIFFQKTGFSEALSGNPVMVCLLTAAFLLAGMFFLHRIQSTVC